MSAGKLVPEAPAPAVDVISKSVAESAGVWFGRQLRGVILIGSLARDEATVVWENGSRKVLGDAEFLLAFSDETPLPPADTLDSFKDEVGNKLVQQSVSVKLDFAAVPLLYLQRLQRSIFTYEVKAYGRVIWGDREIFSLIPAFPASDIPLEDAWRLLCNRIIEVLETVGEMDVGAGELSPALHYRTVKLYQDMATSYLVFVGCYEPSYRSRAERLAQMAADPQHAGDLPFQLAAFSACVSACTRFKLAGPPSGASNELGFAASTDFIRAAMADAHALWRWELARLIGDQHRRSDTELMSKWMRTLPFRARVRGWAHVLSKCGWHRSFGLWPRWLRLAMKSSPRHCVYAAASCLFFRLAERLDPSLTPALSDSDLGRIYSWLPVERRASNDVAGDLRQVMIDICWNYEQFLKDTQS